MRKVYRKKIDPGKAVSPSDLWNKKCASCKATSEIEL